MEMLGFCPSNNKTEILLDQNEAEQFPGAFKLVHRLVALLLCWSDYAVLGFQNHS